MTPTIHWPTDHSPITHTDPPDPPNPPRTHLTWPFLHFKTFYAIQTKYFLKPHDTQYPLTHWPLTQAHHMAFWVSHSLLCLVHFSLLSFSDFVPEKQCIEPVAEWDCTLQWLLLQKYVQVSFFKRRVSQVKLKVTFFLWIILKVKNS